MLLKKMRALSLTLAAMMTCSVISVNAADIDFSDPERETDLGLNKPYLNFTVDSGEGVDISEMKLALKNSKGDTVATFTGGGSLTLYDDNITDLSDVHTYKDLDKIDKKLFDDFYPDEVKGREPTGEVRSESYKCYPDESGKCDLDHDRDYYYYYTDRSKLEIVDTMTVPAGYIVVDVSPRFIDIKDRQTYLYLVPRTSEDLFCELTSKNSMLAYDHAGERLNCRADVGGYNIMITGSGGGSINCESYNRETSYVKVRMKFNDAFPGLASEDLTLERVNIIQDEEYTTVFDLRGDNSVNTFSAAYYSGAAITLPIPDDEGCVEFWVSEETLSTEMRYTFHYRAGPSYIGGGGSYRVAALPKTLEKLNNTFELPQSGYCLYDLPADDYTLVIDDPIDDRDYFISVPTISVTDTKVMQKAAFTVEKKPLLLGDCNRDGIIDSADVVIIGAYIKGEGVLDGRGPVTADIDENGEVDIADVTALAAHVKGLFDIPKKYV